MNALHCLYDKYHSFADFLLVYIAEAHAQDEWPIGSSVCINRPKTMADRRQAAKDMQRDLQVRIPIVIDNMGDEFERTYAAWPFRFYMVKDGVLVYKAQPKDCNYDVSDLEHAITWFL